MKDLAEKLRNGGVDKLNANMLGRNSQGKGDFPRFNYQNDEEYKENFKKIDWKK